MKLNINKKISHIHLTNDDDYKEEKNTIYHTFYSSIDKEVLEFNYGGETFNQIKISTYDGPDYIFNFDIEQQCCEDFGYFHSFDIQELKNYIGTTLKTIELSDDNSFIKFKTDRGNFDVTIYNNHNGYYGHEVNFRIQNII